MFTKEELEAIYDCIDLACDHGFYDEHPDVEAIRETFNSIINKIKKEINNG